MNKIDKQNSNQEQITAEYALQFLSNLNLIKEEISDLQKTIFKEVWEYDLSYLQIIQKKDYPYHEYNLRRAGANLWNILNKAIPEEEKRINKTNFKEILTKYIQKRDPIPESPDSPVPPDSKFYINRGNEPEIYNSIIQSGSLIRIKGKRKSGKTSLMARITNYATSQDHDVVLIDFKSISREYLQSTEVFLKHFCRIIIERLKLTDSLDEIWNNQIGANISCANYLERNILKESSRPIILALDRIDEFYKKAKIDTAQNFFAQIRSWHDRQSVEKEWSKLKYIIIEGETEIEMPPDMSPFNVGGEIVLLNFSYSEIIELAKKYKIQLKREEFEKLKMEFGSNIGHPYLIRKVLNHLFLYKLKPNDFINKGIKNTRPFSEYLKNN